MAFHVNVSLPGGTCPAFDFPDGASTTVRELKLAAFGAIGPTPDGWEDTFTLEGADLTTDALTFAVAGISNEASVTVTRRREGLQLYKVGVYATVITFHPIRWTRLTVAAAELLSLRRLLRPGCAERHCARCNCYFGGAGHAAFRTDCCGRLLCRACLPDPTAPESCWYCAGKDTRAGAETVPASTLTASTVGDVAVAKHLTRQCAQAVVER